MHVADQFEIDWEKAEAERPFMEQWERNLANQQDKPCPEFYAMHWCGIKSRELWEDLPKYERARIVNLWQAEQSDLEWRLASWEPLCEVFYPDGTHGFYPPRPCRIRDFARVDCRPSKEELAAHDEQAKRIADQLAADWSANRPASIMLYDPILASSVSFILGRRVEAIDPPPEHRDAVPSSWLIINALFKEMRKGEVSI